MPATPSSLPYADQIVPDWLRPNSGAINASEAEKYVAAREAAEEKARAYRVAASRLEELTAGRASEAMVEAHRFLAVDHANHSDMIAKFHKAMVYGGDLAQQLDNCLDNIVIRAHQEISVSPPEARDGIIAEAHAEAQAAVADFAEDVTSYHSYVAGLVDPVAAAVIGRTPVPTDKDPTIQPLSGDGGLEQRAGKRADGHRVSTQAGVGGLEQEAEHGGGPVENGGEGSTANGTGGPSGLQPRSEYTRVPIAPLPVSVPRPPPLSGGPGRLMSGLQGLGGVGLGGGSPLPGFATGSPAGLGEVGAGAGGVPQSVANAAGQGGALGSPSSAFAKGLEAAGGGGVPYTPPVTPTAPAAPSTAGGGPTGADAGGVGPATAGSGASAGAMSSGPASALAVSSGQVSAAGSGVHVPVGGAVAGAPGPAPMLLPPPPMGPSGPGAAAGEAVSASAPGGPGTSLASTSSSSPGTALSGGGPGAGAAASVGPTLVPAGVPSPVPVTRAGVERGETPDVSAAKAVVMELLAAGKRVEYVGLSWAAGVFRGPAGPPEMVVMSNEGSGYVPPGVFVPRSARLLVADPLVDIAFRDRWFGWLDPARVLVEYAKLRARDEWTLVAAAASHSVDVLRDNNVPYALCAPELAKSVAPVPAVLDEMHVHRLQLAYPELYERLVRLEDADPRLQEQVIVPLARMMMDAVQQRDDYPVELAAAWATLMSRNELSEDAWKAFDAMMSLFWLDVGAKRPGYQHVSPDEADNTVYRRYWLVARTLEVVRGWGYPRLPLADMVYAAAAVGTLDVRESVAQALARVEAELDR